MNPSTACAHVLVDELVRHGVRHAVLCPGSRSAPLAFALEAAHRAGRLELHVRTDERSAGFLTLGLSRGRAPAVVVTTSGTAVANLHPAVLEASHAGVAMIVLTADRPPELRGTGSNQTTTQPGIFAGATRWSHDLGTPDERPGQDAVWRTVVARAVAAATGLTHGAPGPVHLNLPLREPLVPDDDAVPESGRPAGAPWTTVVAPAPAADPVPDDGRRTLLLVGDLPDPQPGGPDWGQAAADLAAARGWPVLAEPTAGAARAVAVPHAPLLVGCAGWLDGHAPERVVVVGRLTLSRPVAALLRRPGVDVDLVAAPGPWPDPSSVVRSVRPLAALLQPLGSAAGDVVWQRSWADAGDRVAAAVAPLVTADRPSGPGIAHGMAHALPAGARLFVGSSNPVRDLDLAWDARRTPSLRVLANRGLAGIDGCVSTAAGLALAGVAPTYALVGDLTFTHDLAALLVGPLERRPDLTVVVVDDDGGGIFELLEPTDPGRPGDVDRVFGTPLGLDLAALCRGARVPHTEVDDVAGLTAAVAEPPSGLRVVRVRVDRRGHRAVHAALRAAAVGALSR